MERQEWTLEELKSLPADRESASKSGLKFYFTGKSCSRGHSESPRLVANTGCLECKREAQAKYQKTSKGKSTARWAYEQKLKAKGVQRVKDRIKKYQRQLDEAFNELMELLKDSDT